MHVGVVVYDDIETTTGGFLYDRKLVEHLRDHGVTVSVVSLPWHSYPRALVDSFDPRLRHQLRGFDVLVEDELCHPSLLGHNHTIDAPVVGVVHHLRADEQWPPWQKRFYRAIERKYLETVDGAVYVSETTKREAERLTDVHQSVIARPAGDRFDPDVSDEAIAERVERDPFRILFVGSLVPRKGLHVLLDGLSRIPADCQRDDWRLSVVGPESDPEYAETVREQVHRLGLEAQIEFEGRVSDATLADCFAESHLLAVPSTYEGYGIVYLEGMSFGLPALATTAGGANEIVAHEETGFLVPPNDSEEVATALESVLTDREKLREMSLAAKRRAERHPGWDESMAAIRYFLERIVDEQADRREVSA